MTGVSFPEIVLLIFKLVFEKIATIQPRRSDDAKGMQYLIPGWTFDPKRPCMVR